MSDADPTVAKVQLDVDRLKTEVAALCDCLISSGVLRREKHLTIVHQRRFEAAKSAYPCKWTASFEDALKQEKLQALLGLFGPRSVRFLSASSHAAHDALRGATEAWNGLSRHLYVCGGCDGKDASLRSAQRYTPKLGAWEVLPSMSTERSGAAAVAVAGRLYVCGGVDKTINALRSGELFDPVRGQWELLPQMIEARSWATAVALKDCIYMCGGVAENRKPLRSAEMFDVKTGWWASLPQMNVARFGAAASEIMGCVYLAGGDTENGLVLKSAEHLDSGMRAWGLLPDMKQARSGAVAASLGARFYVCGGMCRMATDSLDPEDVHSHCNGGGIGNTSDALSSAERFDPELSRWEALPTMLAARCGAAGITLSGRLYIYGGCANAAVPTPLATAECYDPLLNEWRYLPGTVPARCLAAAAVV